MSPPRLATEKVEITYNLSVIKILVVSPAATKPQPFLSSEGGARRRLLLSALAGHRASLQVQPGGISPAVSGTSTSAPHGEKGKNIDIEIEYCKNISE